VDWVFRIWLLDLIGGFLRDIFSAVTRKTDPYNPTVCGFLIKLFSTAEHLLFSMSQFKTSLRGFERWEEREGTDIKESLSHHVYSGMLVGGEDFKEKMRYDLCIVHLFLSV